MSVTFRAAFAAATNIACSALDPNRCEPITRQFLASAAALLITPACSFAGRILTVTCSTSEECAVWTIASPQRLRVPRNDTRSFESGVSEKALRQTAATWATNVGCRRITDISTALKGVESQLHEPVTAR